MAKWTTKHLKILFDQRFTDLELAVLKAEKANEKRFDGVNEFRGTLSDQAAQLMPRSEAQVAINALRERLDALAVRMERAEGKGAGLRDGWGYLIGAIGILAAIAGLASRFLH